VSPQSPTRGPELDCFEGFPREAVVMSRRVGVSKSRTNKRPKKPLPPVTSEASPLTAESRAGVVVRVRVNWGYGNTDGERSA
jgi:hypothetical protein